MSSPTTWSSENKWWFSITLGLLFFVLASVIAAGLTHAGLGAVGIKNECVDQPTTSLHWWKLLILAILFTIVVRIVLG